MQSLIFRGIKLTWIDIKLVWVDSYWRKIVFVRLVSYMYRCMSFWIDLRGLYMSKNILWPILNMLQLCHTKPSIVKGFSQTFPFWWWEILARCVMIDHWWMMKHSSWVYAWLYKHSPWVYALLYWQVSFITSVFSPPLSTSKRGKWQYLSS